MLIWSMDCSYCFVLFCSYVLLSSLSLFFLKKTPFLLREIINRVLGLAECRQYYLLKQPEKPVEQLEAKSRKLVDGIFDSQSACKKMLKWFL